MLIGIEGFDEVIKSGLPERTTLLMGSPAECGQTVFALQTLVNGVNRSNEPGIFVAFQRSAQQIGGRG